MEIRNDVPLAPLTTFGVGGAARHFARPRDVEELRTAMRWARDRNLPVAILGGGSNVVVEDEGFPGLVIQPGLMGRQVHAVGAAAEISAAAGETWDDLVAFAVDRELQGIECLSGIPGSVGAAPIQNIGAYGQEVGELLSGVEVLDTHQDAVRSLSVDECGLGYRRSRFKTADSGRFVVLAIRLRLRAGARPDVRYPELQRQIDEAGLPSPTLSQVRGAVLQLRARKGMVWDPATRTPRSAGSFFVNPTLTAEALQAAEGHARRGGLLAHGERLPAFNTPDGGRKIPAAWLIERAGYRRGHIQGGAGLSPTHALAITAHGDAAARDVLALAEAIRRAVLDAFGIELVREPVVLGAGLAPGPLQAVPVR